MVETEKYIFSDIGGALCLDFANTTSSYHEEAPSEHLKSYDDLLEWGRQTGVLSEEEARDLEKQAERHPEDADEALDRALELRRAVYNIFAAATSEQPMPQADLEIFNGYLATALGHTKLVEEGDGFDWGWANAEGQLDRMLWPVARSAADLLTSEQLEKVRECGGHDCGWLFLDQSKNHSRRWCDMNDCGNRAKAHRHYKRQKAVVVGLR